MCGKVIQHQQKKMEAIIVTRERVGSMGLGCPLKLRRTWRMLLIAETRLPTVQSSSPCGVVSKVAWYLKTLCCVSLSVCVRAC